MALSRRQQLMSRFAALKKERLRWDMTIRDIAEQMAPYRVFWDWKGAAERNKGDRREDQIINPKPLETLGILSAGMMAGITSPARPWFNLTISDIELGEEICSSGGVPEAWTFTQDHVFLHETG